MTSGVYQITFASSDKRYIGSAINLANRQRGHISKLRHGINGNIHLQRAFNKYGEAEYKFDPLIICDPQNCLLYEQMVMDAFTPERLYNIRPKAESNFGIRFSEEIKEKVRIASTGRKHTPEARAKISAVHLGKVLSAETRARMSVAKKNMSEETKDKIRQARLKQVFTDETREKLRVARTGKHWKQSPEACEHNRLAQLNRVPTSDEARQNMSASAIKAWAKRKEVNL